MFARTSLAALRAGALIACSAATLAGQTTASSSAIPTPASVIGFEPGADRKLPTWKQVTDYFTALDKASPRVTVRTLGKTTLGRPFIVAFIADRRRCANLPRYQQIQRKLMDPRLRARGERERLIADGKLVVLITSSIHSTEVGGILTPLVLAERLARAETPEARQVLANSIIMLVPSQNPDGVDIVGDHYRATLGTPEEGAAPPTSTTLHGSRQQPRLVRLHAGGDALHGGLAVHAVGPADQQRHPPAGRERGRIFIPPYMDPVEPNIDPILTAGTNSLGSAMSWRMISHGFTGGRRTHRTTSGRPHGSTRSTIAASVS
jgi:hypothetical protein